VTASLVAAGFVVDDVRDAPDRPGREMVFIARRPDQRSNLEPDAVGGTLARRDRPACSHALPVVRDPAGPASGYRRDR